MNLKTRATFLHLPLDPGQTAEQALDLASMPASVAAQGLRAILASLAEDSVNRTLA